MTYLISKFFDEYQIDMIHHHMKNTMWEDGLKTVYPVPESDPYSLKKNSQCRCNLKAVFNALDNNSEFLAFTYARESTEPMITKIDLTLMLLIVVILVQPYF